ncbi:MAG: response regulator transcription factor [Saprospiraceae bacterium]|nr:response regulator transcription factor [Saprospiraceae bacterium]
MKLRCIIVDDESLARKYVTELVAQVPFLELVRTCKNAFEAIETLQKESVDLMFLDIQMPGMLGTTLLSGLRERPMVIFITAYSNYAVESYELDVIDYLMKPVSSERFMKACIKAIETRQKTKAPADTSVPEENQPKSPDYFFVNVEYALVRVSIPDITHVEGMKDYVKIYLSSQPKPVITKMTLKSIEEKLKDYPFYRVHKSFIVHLDRIESIRNQEITIGDHEIPISDSNIKDLMKLLQSSDS